MPVRAAGRALARPLTEFLAWAGAGKRARIPTPHPAQGRATGEQVLVVFDIDQSLLKWEEYNVRIRTAEFDLVAGILAEEFTANRVRVALNTGRSLHSVQHVGHFLAPLPIAALVTGDGQQIFWNAGAEPADRWIAALRPRDQDAIWERSHRGAWNEPLALRRLWRAYRDHGFRPVPPETFTWSTDVDHLLRYTGKAAVGELVAVGTGEGPAVKIRYQPEHTDEVHALTELVIHQAIEDLAADGIRALPDFRSWSPFWPSEPAHNYLVAGIKHPTVNKGSPVNWIIAELERLGDCIAGVVPVGDSGNDEGMIVPGWYTGRDARPLPNLPIYHDGGNPKDKVLREIQHQPEMLIVSPVSVFGRLAAWSPDLPGALRRRFQELASHSRRRPR